MAAQVPVPGCKRHSGKGFVYVCQSCEHQLLCMDCIKERHNGHTLGKLTDYVADQKREIQKYVDKLSKTDIPKIERDIRESETNGGGYQKTISDIKRQGKQMKDNIDHTIDLLVKMCTELDRLNTNISEKNKTALTKHLKDELKPKLDRCQEVLTSGTTVDVTTLAREIENTSTVPPTLEKLRTVEFKPGTTSTELLERMLGKILVDGKTQSCQPFLTPVVLSEFTTSFHSATCCTCLTSDEAWLPHWDSDQVYRMDLKGKLKEQIECTVKVESIAVSPTTGNMWLCVGSDRSIREITTGGDIVTRFNVNTSPRSLCITTDDTVLLGIPGRIQLYTLDGRVVSAGQAGPCRQVAMCPHHMVSCTLTGDVAAVDSDGVENNDFIAGKEPDKQPHVIVMDKHLNLKFIWKDIRTAKSSEKFNPAPKFCPNDVCFDGAGDVLVAESVTKSVLLFDRNTGRCMRTVYTSDGETPLSISLHGDGTFWIGHGDRKMKILKFK
ncbi:uncharacterized protein LOC117340454 [Pecten maximus]|uniref:uncharacterized protein LOC117340454 n=1 Tax=Pecten maximus TaxID=6579 RepID=UPI0014588DC5|nr:uncharacterized protein LOC117340454 [Pecten maximus]